MAYVFTRRNVPHIVELRGRLQPRATRGGRHQYASLCRAECPCGWAGATTTSATDARREAITHICTEAQS